jgi:hypothetical protein
MMTREEAVRFAEGWAAAWNARVLLFELATTLNTGNVRNERTVADPERI